MNAQSNSKQGFTIIEVILVLAIAALIFLMIFIALPALQRSQRDESRKQDAGSVASAVSSYRGNARGAAPTAASQVTAYIGDLNQYDTSSVALQSGTGGTLTADNILVNTSAKCNDDGTITTGTSRQATVRVQLEAGGGTPIPFCQDA